MVAERRKSRREAQLKVLQYSADGSDVQCGARLACWKQLELDDAAAAECVGRMGHVGLGTVLGSLVGRCGSALGGFCWDEVQNVL